MMPQCYTPSDIRISLEAFLYASLEEHPKVSTIPQGRGSRQVIDTQLAAHKRHLLSLSMLLVSKALSVVRGPSTLLCAALLHLLTYITMFLPSR